jgi:thiol:disulfide interchange protein
MKRFALLCLIFFIVIDTTNAQIENPVNWKFEYQFLNQKTIQLKFTAVIEKKWHMYGAFFPEGGPIPTSFHFDSSKSFNIIGTVKELTPPLIKKDPNFDNMEISLHNNKAIFVQNILLNKTEPLIIKGYIEFMACNDQKCLPPKNIDFAINIEPSKDFKQAEKSADNSVTESKDSNAITRIKTSAISNTNLATNQSVNPAKSSENQSLWKLFIKAILAGLGGVFTPCVYPMIPLTVMFFLRGSENRSRAILKGIIFGLSIIIIYLFVGLLLGRIIQLVATNWVANLFFFLLFIAFSLSFLGLFEIVLPGSLATKVDKQADKGGLISIFFMALALVIVSSSCTVPIIGSVLIEGSSNLKQSAVSMLGYSLAFALPFSFFAVFPELLKSLPHSGGWLNAFKVIIGLIILMFSFKYLVIVDQSLHLNLLSREIVLSIWTIILLFAGFYLLGKIKFAHDSEVSHITIPRFLFALCAFSFGIYIFANLIYGGNLENFASFLPSKSERPASVAGSSVQNSNKLCNIPKYSSFLHLPYGLQGYFDYKEGLACAKQQNKPVLLDFKGYACANCKVMEAKVWSDPEVHKLLDENFIIVSLYTDERTKLSESEWIKSNYDGKIKKTLGQFNENLEIEMFGSNAQPLYSIADANGRPVVKSIGTELNIQKYISFLKEGIENFRKKSE